MIKSKDKEAHTPVRRRTGKGVRSLTLLVSSATVIGALAMSPAIAENEADRKKAAASKKKAVDSDIAELTEGLAGTSQELNQAYTNLQAAAGQLPAAEAELAAAEDKESAAAAQDAELAAKLATAQENERQHLAQIEQTQTNITESQAAVGRLAASAYRGGTVDAALAVMLSGDNLVEVTDQVMLAESAMKAQNSSVDRLNQERSQMENSQAQLAGAREVLAQLRAQAADVLTRAEAAKADAEAKRTQVQSLVDQRESALAQITSRKAEEEQQLSAMKQRSGALEAELRQIAEQEERQAREKRSKAPDAPGGNSGGGQAKPAPAPVPLKPGATNGKLLRPVPGRLTSPYGYRIHPIYGYKRMHTGQDFAGACGTPIKAAESGTIVKATRAGGYGKQVVMNHGMVGGKPLASSYSHLSRYAVRSGQKVSRGQVIGYVGTTGASTGCHLHFEVFVKGSRTNPAKYL